MIGGPDPARKGRDWSRGKAVLRLALLFLLACLVFRVSPAFAQGQASNPGGGYNDLAISLQNSLSTWRGTLTGMANYVFWALATIELILVAVPLAVKGADIQEFAFALIKLILFLGFFLALIGHGANWMNDIVLSFIDAGTQVAGYQSVALDQVLNGGISAAAMIFNSFSLMGGEGGAQATFMGNAALVILLSYAVMGVAWAIAIFESYFIVAASTLLFALGGTQFTSDIARRTFLSAIAIGFKLFLIEIIIGTGNATAMQWASYYNSGPQTAINLFGLLVMVFMFAVMTVVIPSFAARLVNGAQGGNPLNLAVTGIASAISNSMSTLASTYGWSGGGRGGSASAVSSLAATGGTVNSIWSGNQTAIGGSGVVPQASEVFSTNLGGPLSKQQSQSDSVSWGVGGGARAQSAFGGGAPSQTPPASRDGEAANHNTGGGPLPPDNDSSKDA